MHDETRIWRAAILLSLLSTFNIGFGEIDFGKYIRMLMTDQYDIRPEGWARTVSGVQSLICVYLLALWILAYFGHPFDF